MTSHPTGGEEVSIPSDDTSVDIDKTFVDIHTHALDLSHPNFLVMVNRFKLENRYLALFLQLRLALGFVIPFIESPAYVLAWSWLREKVRTTRNLLAVLDTDAAGCFLLMENCLRSGDEPLLDSEGLRVGERTYKRVVICPLVIDFECEYRNRASITYDLPPHKPALKQAADVLSGIAGYKSAGPGSELAERYPALADNDRVFEIYPFLGINPANYSLKALEALLERCFSGHTGRRNDLQEGTGRASAGGAPFSDHAFAGIKLYPPLGFDPWPKSSPEDPAALDKVKLLYGVCEEKKIPMTVHGGSGGYVAFKDKEKLLSITSVGKWSDALLRFPDLKLNLAHFPLYRKRFFGRVKAKDPRLDETVQLIESFHNVYADVSVRVFDDDDYRKLAECMAAHPALEERVMFGSDFPMLLFRMDSYHEYIEAFSRTEELLAPQKHALCSTAPQRFLFNDA